MTQVMAIDFGTRRVGLALSRGTLAEPFEVIPHDENLFAALQERVIRLGVQKIVIGLSENEMALKTQQFGENLAVRLPTIPVEFFDETLSSHTVEERLRQQGIKHSTRTGPIDHFAAAVILEEWMEQSGFRG